MMIIIGHDLTDSVFRFFDFTDSTIRSTTAIRADFRGAIWRDVELENVDFTNALVCGAQIGEAIMKLDADLIDEPPDEPPANGMTLIAYSNRVVRDAKKYGQSLENIVGTTAAAYMIVKECKREIAFNGFYDLEYMPMWTDQRQKVLDEIKRRMQEVE